jgi:uncharacterized protein (TIGR01777 family)
MAPSIALTGSTGLIASALTPALAARGWSIRPLVRRAAAAGEVRWDPAAGTLDLEALRGVTAAVHLAGEPLAEGRWTEERKRRIRSSRVQGTRLLAESLARLDPRPEVLVSASAVGIYGNRGDEVLDEASAPGSDFLADVAREWEEATEPARAAGIRVVTLRFGVILAREGGALPRMLRPFLLGVGGPIGDGRQWMSWIAIDDAVGVVLAALRDPVLAGPVNAVAPHSVRNSEFAETLGRVLHRPALLPAPALALRLLFGEMADAALLASQRVVPGRLEAVEFPFQFRSLTLALRAILDR